MSKNEDTVSILNNMDGTFTCLYCTIGEEDIKLDSIVEVKDHLELHWNEEEFFDAEIQDRVDELLLEYITNDKIDVNKIGHNLSKKEN